MSRASKQVYPLCNSTLSVLQFGCEYNMAANGAN